MRMLMPLPQYIKKPFNLEDYRIYKVPEAVYQVMFDIACDGYAEAEYRRRKVRSELEDWVKQKYPGKVLNAFIDINSAEAKELQNRLGYPFEWGMYTQVIDPDERVPLISTVLRLNNK